MSRKTKKNDINPILKNIELRDGYGCATLTYEVYVKADFKLLEQIHKNARKAIIKRLSDEVEAMNEKMFKEMDKMVEDEREQSKEGCDRDDKTETSNDSDSKTIA